MNFLRLIKSSRLVVPYCPIRPLSTGLCATFNRPRQLFPDEEGADQLKTSHQTGLFNHDILEFDTGFYLFREDAVLKADRLVSEALKREKRKRKMVEIFDELSNTLCKCADLAEFVRVGHPTHRFQAAAQQCSTFISAEVERLNTNRPLYDELKESLEGGDTNGNCDPMDKHVTKLFLFDFEQSGIHMSDDARLETLRMQELIQHVGSYFVSNSHEPRKVPKEKLPQDIRNSFDSTRDFCHVADLHPESESEAVREAAYRIYLFPDDHQENLLQRLLTARLQLANLCGFSSYAHRAVAGSIMGTPENIKLFTTELSSLIAPLADQDYETMFRLKNIKSLDGNNRPLRPWDVPYFTSTFKKSEYSKDVELCLPYFSLGSCMDGLSFIFNSLYGINLQVEETRPGETWHGDVIKLSIRRNGEAIGTIYCDFWERSGKINQDCHYTIQGGCQLSDGSRQLPIVVLMLSLPRPASPNDPSLLPPHMVDNLFHEMGHAMHSMIGQTAYQHVTGTRCSTDLAEVPSILMEYFASDQRVVSKFARHYATGEMIPEKLLRSWISSKRIFNASDTQLQLFYSILDQVYHSSNPLQGFENTTEVIRQVHNTYYGLPYVEHTAWQHRFTHLVGYGAKYYAYLVSRAIAASIWRNVFAADPLSRSAGERYETDLLRHGGGVPPATLVKNVLESDSEVTPSSLAASLVEDVIEFSPTPYTKPRRSISPTSTEEPKGLPLS